MLKKITLLLLISCTACTPLLLSGCKGTIAAQQVELGKQKYEAGYYKSAMKLLLPPAVAGNPEAEYGVGYMYYYGYGVAQDTDTGIFWIEKAADQHYQPAIDALKMIKSAPKPPVFHTTPAQVVPM